MDRKCPAIKKNGKKRADWVAKKKKSERSGVIEML